MSVLTDWRRDTVLSQSLIREWNEWQNDQAHEQQTGKNMLTYKAIYKYLDEGVHAEVLDFPGALTCGADLENARRLLADALAEMAETSLLHGEPLPTPDPACTDPDADLEEPIHLLLTAASRVRVAPLNTFYEAT